MGLFNFFKKKKKDSEQESTPTNSILLAMPLFKNEEAYDIDKIVEHLKSFWQLNVSEANDINNETAVFNINDQMVAIAMMPAPVPWEELESVAPYNYSWPTSLEDIKEHNRHAIVSVLSGNQAPAERYSMLSKLLCSIMMTSNCIGVYQGQETLLLSKDYYLSFVDDLLNNEIPVPLWVYVGIRPDENEVSLYTYGLTNFGKHELEIIESKMKTEDLYDFMINITSYIISSNVTLHDGETIGYSADHKVPLKLSKGVYIDGETIKMQL